MPFLAPSLLFKQQLEEENVFRYFINKETGRIGLITLPKGTLLSFTAIPRKPGQLEYFYYYGMGDHALGLGCRKHNERIARHDQLCDVLYEAASSAHTVFFWPK